MAVRYGLVSWFGSHPSHDLDFVTGFARLAEDLGFDSIWCPEHLVLFESYESAHPYSDDGVFAYGDHNGIIGMYDPLFALQAIGCATSTLRLGTNVVIATLRNPIQLAKEVATLDRLSSGRLDLGIGLGWNAAEYAAVGVPFTRKGARLDEYVDVLVNLWTTHVSEFQGEFFEYSGVLSHPKPLQQPHPPIFIGGQSPAALDRLARCGAGWSPWNVPLNDLPALLGDVEQRLQDVGRRREDVTVQLGYELLRPPTADDLARIREYAQIADSMGVDRVIFNPWAQNSFASSLEQIAGSLRLSV